MAEILDDAYTVGSVRRKKTRRSVLCLLAEGFNASNTKHVCAAKVLHGGTLVQRVSVHELSDLGGSTSPRWDPCTSLVNARHVVCADDFFVSTVEGRVARAYQNDMAFSSIWKQWTEHK